MVIDLTVVDFALRMCEQFLKESELEDMDEKDAKYGADRYLGATESEWHDFTLNYYKLAQLVLFYDQNLIKKLFVNIFMRAMLSTLCSYKRVLND